MKAMQIGTLLLVGLVVVGLAFVGPVAAHGDGPTTTTNETAANDSVWNGTPTEWNDSTAPPWMASHMTEEQYQWMASYMTQEQYEWMASHMGLNGDHWSTDRPDASTETGYATAQGGFGGGMGSAWTADDSTQSADQWSTDQNQGSWGPQTGHGC